MGDFQPDAEERDTTGDAADEPGEEAEAIGRDADIEVRCLSPSCLMELVARLGLFPSPKRDLPLCLDALERDSWVCRIIMACIGVRSCSLPQLCSPDTSREADDEMPAAVGVRPLRRRSCCKRPSCCLAVFEADDSVHVGLLAERQGSPVPAAGPERKSCCLGASPVSRADIAAASQPVLLLRTLVRDGELLFRALVSDGVLPRLLGEGDLLRASQLPTESTSLASLLSITVGETSRAASAAIVMAWAAVD
jgi:hypothetical protein